MEKINESGLEILKGDKLVVIDSQGNTIAFFDFCEGLLKKGYKIITINNYLMNGSGWKTVLPNSNK